MTLSVWPLVAAALAGLLIGYGWYHPRAFGRFWMRSIGVQPDMAERAAKRAHIHEALGFAACIVAAYVLRLLLIALNVGDIAGAARLGALLGIGIAAPVLLGSVLWEHRPLAVYLINAGYWFATLVVMAVILVL